MKEWFQRLFGAKSSSPDVSTTLLSTSFSENPEIDLRLRYSILKKQAEIKKQQGGDAQLEQQTKELIALTMGNVRKSVNLNPIEVSRTIKVSFEDYQLAEAGVLEDERFEPLLDLWLEACGYEKAAFLDQAETGAREIIRHNRQAKR